MSPVTFETLTSLHIKAVRKWAAKNNKKILLALCKNAARHVDPLSKIAAMRRVAEAYNRLHADGALVP